MVHEAAHPMTKSPRAVAREALRLAQEALPAYSSKYSRKDFTQHQLFAVLALKTFLKTDYRGRRAVPGRLRRAPRRPRADRRAPLLDPVLRRAAAPKKGEFVVLLCRATASAADRGLIGEKPDRRGRRDRAGEPAHLPLLLQAGRQEALLPAVDQADRRLRHPQPLPRRGGRHHRPVQRLPAVPPGHGPGVPGRHLGPGAGRRRVRQRGAPPVLPGGPRGAVHRDPAEPPRSGPEVAQDPLPAADGQAVPQEAPGEPAPAGVRPAVAGRVRVQPAQAAARELRSAAGPMPRASGSATSEC